MYFYNADTDESMVEHPLEVQYRQMYTEAKMGAGGRGGGGEDDDFDPEEAVPISHQEVPPLQRPPFALLPAGVRGRACWSLLLYYSRAFS